MVIFIFYMQGDFRLFSISPPTSPHPPSYYRYRDSREESHGYRESDEVDQYNGVMHGHRYLRQQASLRHHLDACLRIRMRTPRDDSRDFLNQEVVYQMGNSQIAREHILSVLFHISLLPRILR